LQQAGERAGVARYVVVSIIGIEKSAGGYGSAKLAHEQAVLAGPVPARILRVAQFHELVGLLMDMGRQGDVIVEAGKGGSRSGRLWRGGYGPRRDTSIRASQ
jgi:hypothetical protein